MRKIITLFLLFGLTTLNSVAQSTTQPISENEVPQQVLDNQLQLFPNSFVDGWEIQQGFEATEDNTIRYISKFHKSGRPGFTASYLPNGLLIFQSAFMTTDNIPETVRLKLQANFNKFDIMSANFISLFNPKREIYQVKIRDDARAQYIYYDINGKLIEENALPPEIILLLN